MKRTIILCIIGAAISMMTANAQDVETIYYDSDGQIVKVKEFADYYRIIESGDSFPKIFRDYYRTGEKFRTGGKLWASTGMAHLCSMGTSDSITRTVIFRLNVNT